MAQKFVSNRDVVVRSSKYGRSYAFKKGVPRDDVIPQMHQDLFYAGIMPVDGEVKEDSVAEPDKPKLMIAPEDGEERKLKILEAMEAIVGRNDSKDFTGAGMPSGAAVTRIVGWRVDNKDVAEVWKENKAALLKGK